MTLPLTQIVSIIIAGIYYHRTGDTLGAGGILVLFQIIPISPGSLARGLYAVGIAIYDRSFKDYNIAVFLSFFKYIGYLAFPIQMTYRYPAMSRFMADPDLAFVYGDGVLLTSSGDFLSYVPQVEPFDRFRLLNQYNYIMQPATFFKKQVLDSLGYLDMGLNYVMDWDLWCRFAQAGCRFLYEPALLAADTPASMAEFTAPTSPRIIVVT